MGKPFDRKAIMRATTASEKVAVEARFAPALDRFSRAEAISKQFQDGSASAPSSDVDGATGVLPRTLGTEDTPVTVTLDLVHDNPYNARAIYEPEVVSSLAVKIASQQQLVPAVAVQHPGIPGHYMLIDGHYRKKAIVAAGKSTINLLVKPATSDLELYTLSYSLNQDRSAQTPLDNAYAWQKLLEQGLVTEGTQIAERLGISTAAVAKTLALLKIPSDVLAKMSENPAKFGVALGYEISLLAKVMSPQDLLQLINRIVEEDLSSREVAGIRARIESGQTRKPKETSRQYKIHRGGQEVGSLKEWDSGKVLLDMKLVDPKERAALVKELRDKLGIQD
jgi:ParB family chromosome partitioning protein